MDRETASSRGNNSSDSGNAGPEWLAMLGRNRRQWLWLGVVCYLLALPLLALELSIDIGFGRDLCNPRPVGSLGTIFDSGGYPLCQLQFLGILLHWTFLALIVSPLPLLARIIHRQVQQAGTAQPMAGSGDQQPQPIIPRVLSIVLYILLAGVAVYVAYWEMRILHDAVSFAPPTGGNCLCTGIDVGNYGGMSNSDGIPVCCTVNIDQALHAIMAYSLLSLPLLVLALYGYRKIGASDKS